MAAKLSRALLPFILVLSSLQYIQAANDWSQPCFSGTCSYDLPDNPDGASGTLKIWGANTAIADITPAAGWEIVSCDPQSLAQDLRIVCRDGSDSGGCAHLFDVPAGSTAAKRAITSSTASASAAGTSGTALPSDGQEQGAVGKIVRLPENCGKSAFARISKAWIPTDQSIPSSVAKRLVKRDGETPVMKAVSIDLDFNATSTGNNTGHGPVGFAIVGANVPGAAAKGDLDTSSVKVAKRSFSRVYAQRGIGDFIGNAVDAVSSLNDFDVDKSTTLKPLDVNKTFNLIDQQISCTLPAPVAGLNSSVGVNGKVKVDVDANVHALVSLGVAASGTLIPPKVQDFGITGSMTADVDSSILMNAGVGGTLDSGKIKILEVGVPGLSFPGVLEIGPSFQVNAQAKASLNLDLDMTVGVKYHVDKAEFVFPQGGKKGGTFTPGDTPLKLSVQPSGTATGKIEAHLIPSLNLGISALGGIVGAGVFLELDASTSATLGVGATAPETNVTLGRRSSLPEFEIDTKRIGRLGYPAGRIRGRNLIGENYFAKSKRFGFGDIVDGIKGAAESAGSAIGDAAGAVGGAIGDAAGAVKDKAGDVVDAITGNDGPETTTTDAAPPTTTAKAVDIAAPSTTKAEATSKPIDSATATSKAAPDATQTAANSASSSADTGASFGGCLEVDAGLDVNVGANADFFGLFNPSTKLPLFSKSFSLFKKCFGDPNQVQRRSESEAVVTMLEKRAFDLKCNGVNLGKASELANQVISASKLV